jgi:hypothetical protein
VLHARDEASYEQGAAALRAAFTVGDGQPVVGEPVLEVIR